MSKSRSKRTGDDPVVRYFEWRVTELIGHGYAEADPTSRDIAREADAAITLYRVGSYQWRRNDDEPWMAAEHEPDVADNLAP